MLAPAFFGCYTPPTMRLTSRMINDITKYKRKWVGKPVANTIPYSDKNSAQPWKVSDSQLHFLVRDRKGEIIAQVKRTPKSYRVHSKKDAELIAAAPTLFIALGHLLLDPSEENRRKALEVYNALN